MVKRFNQTRFNSPVIPDDLATKKYVDSSGGASPLTTKGDLFGFDTVDDRIPIGTNNQVLTADSAQGLGLKWATPGGGSSKTFAKVVKSADQTVNNTTTLQDDDELLFTGTINKIYSYLLMMNIRSDSTPDLKIGWNVPTGATYTIANNVWGSASPSFTETTTMTMGTTTGFDQVASTRGKIIMDSTAGNSVLEWAQQTANVSDTKMLLASTLLVWEE